MIGKGAVRTVFLSSVAQGLEEYREAVYKAIEGLDGYHCVRMEDFAASPSEPAKFCAEKVRSCDVLVGIVGQRHGSCPLGEARSMTEIEYDAACENGVPCLMFVAPEEFPVPGNLIESDDKRERIAAFRRRVKGVNTVAPPFANSSDLVRDVLIAFHNCRDALLASGQSESVPQTRRTYLLFPWVTNSFGFDTGVAISNTGATPFGTAGESGVCTIHYYGVNAQGQQPSPQSSCVVSPGETLRYVLSTSGYVNGSDNILDNRGASFQGYIVVECHFPFAHGFATIFPVGATANQAGLTSSYLAITIDPINNRQ